ncbi:hypothetical protein CL634_11110 [bacterium]|nr:hypothetical protein [bacterium]
MKEAFVWCDCDLDGAVSYCLLCWYFGKKLPHKTTTVSNFDNEFTTWKAQGNLEKYEKVFIVDINPSKVVDAVDKDNIIIIDHHTDHVDNKGIYKKATTVLERCTSCAKLMYETLKKKLDITESQKLLVLLADDYDSYTLAVPQSYMLNVVLWSMQGDRVAKFYENFNSGFNGFDNFQKNILLHNEKKLNRMKRELQVYKTFLVINGKEVRFVSCVADSCINELAHYIIEKYKGDIGIIVNLKTQRLSIRRSKQCSIDLSALINKIGTGGGHEYAAGGEINEKFLTFSKLLIPANEQVSTVSKKSKPKDRDV